MVVQVVDACADIVRGEMGDAQPHQCEEDAALMGDHVGAEFRYFVTVAKHWVAKFRLFTGVEVVEGTALLKPRRTFRDVGVDFIHEGGNGRDEEGSDDEHGATELHHLFLRRGREFSHIL